MANNQMWWATREYGMWVRCPSVEMPSSKSGWVSSMDYLNGGAYVRRSTAAHKNYTLSWNILTRDQSRPILDFADRLYGDGPFYWIDPVAARYNLLPQWFASPFQGLDDGIILTGDKARGEVVQTPMNSLGYPIRSIRYDVTSGSNPTKVWIPIPPGMTAWVGAHGQDGTGGEVVVTPTTGPATTGAPTTLTLLDVTDDTRVNASFSGSTGIYVALGGEGTITLSGLMVQIWPTGMTPPTGGFISGQGHSGCEFTSQPEYTPYSDVFDQGAVIAEMTEVGGWLG